MTSDSDALILGALAGGIGYLGAKAQYTNWDPVIKEYKARYNSLAFAKAIKPFGAFYSVPNSEIIYIEAFSSFLFGMPNASISMSLKFFETILKNKQSLANKQESNASLCQLIDWAEDIIGVKKEEGHVLRILRNHVMHGDILATEQDALETLRHVSVLTNVLYPYDTATKELQCPMCKFANLVRIKSIDYYLGNNFNLPCSHCAQTIAYSIS